jgi:hypothetical protein
MTPRDEIYQNIRLTFEEKISDLLRVMNIPANSLTIGEAYTIGQDVIRVVNTARNVIRSFPKEQ